MTGRAFIFLDIDGVLNSLRSTVAFRGTAGIQKLDPVAVRLVDRLCVELREAGWQARVVISSTWRQNYTSLGWWRQNFPEWDVVGATPVRGHAEHRRGKEVAEWMEQNGDCCPFVCIDDDNDFLPDQPLVLTTFEHGLQIEHIDRAFEIITGKRMEGLPRIFAPPVAANA